MTDARAVATDVAGDPWMYHMRRGNFAVAWEICDRVLHARRGMPCSHLPRHQQSIWDGTALAGKRVLIRCYHGLGDTVQFIRFVPLVKAIAREVIVWAQPSLLPIFRTVSGINRLLPLHDGTPEVDYDVDVESMELAHVFRITPGSLRNYVPYLRTSNSSCERQRVDTSSRPTEPCSYERERVEDRVVNGERANSRKNDANTDYPPPQRHIGLVWSCSSPDEPRCIPLRCFDPLLATRKYLLACTTTRTRPRRVARGHRHQ